MAKLIDIEALIAHNNNVDSRLVKLENVTNGGAYLCGTELQLLIVCC